MQILIPISIIIIYAITLTILLKKKIEQTIPISIIEIVLIIYVAGIFDNLKLGIQIIEGMAIFKIAIILYLTIKEKETKKIKENIRRIITPGLIVYLVLSAILAYINQGRIFNHHDEFTHWALIVKNMFIFNTYGTNTQSLVEFNEYPPFTAIFQYLFLGINKTYREDLIITAQGILYLSIIIPVMKNIEWKKDLKKLLIIIPIIVAIPMILYNNFYLEILVDGILGVMFAITIYYEYENEEIKFKYLKIFTGLTMLCLTKPTGIALAIFAVTIHFIELLKNIKKSKKEIKIMLLICAIITILTSIWYVKIDNVKHKWEFSQYIKNDSTIDKGQMVQKYIDNILYNQCLTDKNITTFLMILILVCTNMYVLKYSKQENDKKLKYYLIIMLVTIPIYLLAQFITYIAIFDVQEAQNLECFDRYTSTIILAVVMFQTLVVIEKEESKINFKKIFVGITIIMCMLPQKNIINKYIDGSNYIATEQNNRDFYTNLKKYKKILGQNDTILFINNSNNSIKKVNLLNQYEMMPIKLEMENGTISNVNELQKKILRNKYSYVYIYKIDESEKNDISGIFENEYVENDTLYRVVEKNDKIILEIVRR